MTYTFVGHCKYFRNVRLGGWNIVRCLSSFINKISTEIHANMESINFLSSFFSIA